MARNQARSYPCEPAAIVHEGVRVVEEGQWERIGAGAGIVFVVLLVVSAFIVPSPPHIDASTPSIVAWVDQHRHALLAAQMLGVLSIVAFLWFVGHLRHVLDRAEGGAEALSPIVLVSGATLAAAGGMAFLPLTIM